MFWNLKEEFGFDISMSRATKCLDNHRIESLWGIYKSEFYYRYKFLTLESLISETERYINFYCNERYMKKINGLTPAKMRAQAVEQNLEIIFVFYLSVFEYNNDVVPKYGKLLESTTTGTKRYAVIEIVKKEKGDKITPAGNYLCT